MNVQEARFIVSDAANLVNGVSLSPTRTDHAIRMTLEKLLAEAHLDRVVATIPTVPTVATLNFTTLPFFTPRRFIRAWVQNTERGRPLSYHAYNNVRALVEVNASSGEPELVSWAVDNQALLYPIPDSAYVLDVTYWRPLVAWTLGDTGGATLATVINVPEEYLREALYWGAASAAVLRDPARLALDDKWNRFEDLILRVRDETDPDMGVWTSHPDDRI